MSLEARMSSSSDLEYCRADFPALLAAHDDLERDFAARAAQLNRAAAPLSIGIIGQVKAGKSSFLNALLFDGETVLPKAATPKTANLTRIRHGEQAALRVSFYSTAEWQELEALAAGPREDDAARAAREVVQDARERGTPLAECLGQPLLHRAVASVAELQAVLNDYVGNDGRFTPVVAATEIDWPHPALQGIEIVDTPGVNDPIQSRVQKTRDYLAACDVVFLLSRASNFVDEHDVALFAQQAPVKGVKRLLLVATQFDSAVLDDGYDRDSLAETCANLRQRLSRHADKSLAPAVHRLQASGREALADRVAAAAKQPLFMSSFAHAFAERSPELWEEDLRHVHANIVDLAKDVWREDPPSREQWQQLAGFAPLREVLNGASADKDAILAEQRAQLEPEWRQRLAEWAEDCTAQVRDRLALLERNDLAELAARETALNAQMGRIAVALSSFVGETAQAADARSRVLQTELRDAAARAARLETRTGYKTERHRVTVSDSVWYNPFSWGSSHDESYSTTTAYRYVAVSDAIEQILRYVRQAEAQLAAEIERLASPKSLSAGLRRVLLDVIDTKDERYDPLALRALVAQTLDAVRWPHWDFTLPDPTAEIVARFGGSGELKSESDMAALRLALDSLMSDLNERLARALETRVTGQCQQLGALSDRLMSSLTQALKEDLSQLRLALEQGEAAKARFQAFLVAIGSVAAD